MIGTDRARRTGVALALAAGISASVSLLSAETAGDVEPERIRDLAAELAELRGADPDEVAEAIAIQGGGPIGRARALWNAGEGAARAPEGRALARLGAGAAEIEGAVSGLPGARLGGYYDLDEGRLYVGDASAASESGLVWSVARAVRDRGVDAASFLQEAESTDELLARRALFEGDAAALALERQMRREGLGVAWGSDAAVELLRELGGARADGRVGGGDARADPLAEAPEEARERLLFPFREGAAFVARVRRERAWSAVDAMYEKPPLSTSHILHPERYARYDRPREIEAGGVGADDLYERAFDDVLGELGLKIWLKARGVDPRRAARGASGWAGDRLVVYEPPARLGGLWPELAIRYTSWETELDAVEFFEAAARAVEGLSESGARSGDGRFVYDVGAMDRGLVERRGDAVVVVMGAPPAWAEEIREAVWENFRARAHSP